MSSSSGSSGDSDDSSSSSSASESWRARRPVRANRGARLAALLKEGFSDEDDINDEWKDRPDDKAYTPPSSDTDDCDSDFSQSESSGKLSEYEGEEDPEKAAAREDRAQREKEKKSFMKRKGKPQQQLLGDIRQRQPSKITQAERMAAARARAEEQTAQLADQEVAFASASAIQGPPVRRRRKETKAQAAARFVSSYKVLQEFGVAHVLCAGA